MQFIMDVNWERLTIFWYLPPGTGDVQISLAQIVRRSARSITTPQDIAAFRDAASCRDHVQ